MELDDSTERLEAVRSFLSSGLSNGFQGLSNGGDTELDEQQRLAALRNILAREETREIENGPSLGVEPRYVVLAKPRHHSPSVTLVAPSPIKRGPAVERQGTPTRGSDNDRAISRNSQEEQYQRNGADSNRVFERLYSMHKAKSLSRRGVRDEQQFQPRIDPKSRHLAMQTERGSLYERAVQQRFRQESVREMHDRQEREDRSRSRTLQTSQQLAWNRLRREIEHLYSARLHAYNIERNQPESEEIIMALNHHMFRDVLKHLNLQDVTDELFDMLSDENDGLVYLEAICRYIKQVSFPESGESPTDEFSTRVKRLLIGKKAIPNQSALEKVFREIAAETPFSPQITNKSRELDEKRYLRMGIDPNLPRSEKIHAELKLQAVKNQTKNLIQAKKELEHCTFRPKTNKTSSAQIPKIPADTSPSDESKDGSAPDVGSRLYRDSLDRRTRLMKKKEERDINELNEETAECTFRPKTNTHRPNVNPVFSVQDTPLRAKAYESSVERLRTWREKHVPQEDTADIMYATKKKKQEENHSSRRTLSKRVQTKDVAFPRKVRQVVFEADVALPNGAHAVVQVRQGDDLVRVAEAFGKKHGIDKIAETALLKSLQQSVSFDDDDIPAYRVEESFLSDSPVSATEGDESTFLVIDVLVRPGETYELRLASDEDPIQVAHEFAADVGMDQEALDRLVESLANLQAN